MEALQIGHLGGMAAIFSHVEKRFDHILYGYRKKNTTIYLNTCLIKRNMLSYINDKLYEQVILLTFLKEIHGSKRR